MVDALCRELDLRRTYLGGEVVETIYFGGGTPSLLTAAELARILETVRGSFAIAHNAEITLEANPDDLGAPALALLRALGINRLSIGIQSFDDGILASLNRIHDAASGRESIRRAKAAGFDNISIDMIYAIPGLDNTRWRENVEEAIQQAPQHISSYTLTIEDKTLFGKWQRQGKLHAVADDVAADQYEIMAGRLEQAGFEHYEVSNFARPGYRSRHNSSYWLDRPYLGVGPGAHSYDMVSRQYNVRDNNQYIARLAHDNIPATTEVLSRADKINEYLLISLRTNWGADLAKLRDELHFDVLQQHTRYIGNLESNGLATVTGNALVLTSKGRLLADEIVTNLAVDGSQRDGR